MSKIIIVTDSTCDLSQEIIDKYDFKVLPLYVNFGDKVYKDRIEMDVDKMYATVEEKGVYPKTSAASPDDFYKFFKDLLEEDVEIIDVHGLTEQHPEWFEKDGIHPNNDGAKSIAELVAGEIKR